MPLIITWKLSQKINTSNCFTKTFDNKQNNFAFSLNYVFWNSFPSIKHHCTFTREIENIIRSLKSSNSCGYDEVPSKLLKSCSYFISVPLNYVSNRTLFTGVFPDRLKCTIIRPLFKKGKKDDISNCRPISVLTSFSKLLRKYCKVDFWNIWLIIKF